MLAPRGQSYAAEHARRRVSRRIAVDEPWNEAVLRVIETGVAAPEAIVATLGIPAEAVQRRRGWRLRRRRRWVRCLLRAPRRRRRRGAAAGELVVARAEGRPQASLPGGS
jgi:hypothetical protein